MSLSLQLESLLFVSSESLSVQQMAKAVGFSTVEVQKTLDILIVHYTSDKCGIVLCHEGQRYRMVTNPKNATVVKHFVKDQIVGELTKAQLETLTVVAYRGPLTRPEIEEIRGVNCAVILRNLLIRGLIDEQQDKKDLSPNYTLSFHALRHLGINTTSELPDYETLCKHPNLGQTDLSYV